MPDRKEAYAAKLRDPRWQKKRLKILERDGWKCRHCGRHDLTLHVHHLWYEDGAEPWEHEDRALLTLCESCHDREGEDRREADRTLIQTLATIGLTASDIRELDYAMYPLRGQDRGNLLLLLNAIEKFVKEPDELIQFMRPHLEDVLKKYSIV